MTNPVIENVRLEPRKADRIFEVRWLEDGKARRKSTKSRDRATAEVARVQIEADIRAARVPDGEYPKLCV